MSARKETPDVLGDVLSKNPTGPAPALTGPQAQSLRIADIRRDGGTQPRSGLDEGHVADLMAAIENGAILPPVDVTFDGDMYWLYDGYHRTEAYSRQGKYTVLAIVHQGTLADAQWASYSANAAHGLKRTNEDKKRQTMAALRHPKGATMGDREIAQYVGVDHKTVGFYRSQLTSGGEIPQVTTRTGADGKTYDTTGISESNAKRAKPAAKSAQEPQRPYATPQRIEDLVRRRPNLSSEYLRKAAIDPERHFMAGWLRNDCDTEFGVGNWDMPTLIGSMRQVAAEIDGFARQAAPAPVTITVEAEAAQVPVTETLTSVPASKEIGQEFYSPEQDDADAILNPVGPVSLRDGYDGDEWYTPSEYIEAARRVMGSIDLDPASCKLAQSVVKAGCYLTKTENGLGQSRWLHKHIWLNPPYGSPDAWISKLLMEFDNGTFVHQAVVLVNNATATVWFQSMLTRFPVCFLNRRIAFWRHDQAGITARQGQAIFYLGDNDQMFAEVFRQFGPVMMRVA